MAEEKQGQFDKTWLPQERYIFYLEVHVKFAQI